MQNFALSDKKSKERKQTLGTDILDLENANFDTQAFEEFPWLLANADVENKKYIFIQPKTISDTKRPRTLVVESDTELNFNEGFVSSEDILNIFQEAKSVDFNPDNITSSRVDVIGVRHA